jgi:hypothetical protein
MKLRKTPSTCGASIPSPATCSTPSSSISRLEMLDLVHRTYESDESFRSLDFMVHTRLGSQVILQIFLGTLVPLALLAANQFWKFSEAKRKVMYMTAGGLT